MFKNYIQIAAVAAILVFVNDARADSTRCNTEKVAAEFIFETSRGMSESRMRELFPRHTHIIYEIYNSKNPRYVPTKVYKNCLRDLPV